jgi:membrane fusion protein, multidrug efflux system
VTGLGAGTGAAFSLLPAQNATGNWIKVVQRVPVRIALDAAQLADKPLRVGLSMEAEVDVRNQDGKTLADAPNAAAMAPAPVLAVPDDAANADVRRVIAANSGKPQASTKEPVKAPEKTAEKAPEKNVIKANAVAASGSAAQAH